MKLLRINISNRSFIITFVAIGFSLSAFSFSLTTTPSWIGILVYKDFTFIDTNIVSFASSCMFLSFNKKTLECLERTMVGFGHMVANNGL